MLKLEEDVLNKAVEAGLRLRLSLANRERLPAVIREFGRFDMRVELSGGELTLSKKELYYISSLQPIIEPPAQQEAETQADRTARSRVQDEFLARYVKDKTLALLTLVNGEEHRGVIEGYDGFTVLVKAGAGQMLVYKHGLLSIGPGYRRREKGE